MTEANLTLDRLKEVLSYDPETGVFKWLKPTSNRVRVGSEAGNDNGVGYLRISVDGRTYYAHRLAWMYLHGALPDQEIDHTDGNPKNNAASNLRHAAHAENSQNQKLRSTNTSGRHGVSWSKPHGKWAAYIMKDGRKRHLGLFEGLDAAGSAYLRAKSVMHSFQPVPRDA